MRLSAQNGTGKAGMTLATLLAQPDAVDALPPDRLLNLLGDCATEHLRIAIVEDRARLRLVRGLVPAPEQPPLTQEEAARRYHMPLRLVRKLTRTGLVPSYPQGRNRMIRPADLDRYLARCQEQGVKVGTILDV
jgi:Helix-turn-helix domain